MQQHMQQHKQQHKKLELLILIFSLTNDTAAVHGVLLLQDGHQYEYETTYTASTGTMDVATHSSGEQSKVKTIVQVKGRTLNINVSFEFQIHSVCLLQSFVCNLNMHLRKVYFFSLYSIFLSFRSFFDTFTSGASF